MFDLASYYDNHKQKIKKIFFISLGSICVIGTLTGLILTIALRNKPIPLTFDEVRKNVSLKKVIDDNKEFHYIGTNVGINGVESRLEINVGTDYYFLNQDENIFQIYKQDDTFIVSDNIELNGISEEEYIENKRVEILTNLYFFNRRKDINNYKYSLKENYFELYDDQIFDDVLKFDYNGLLIEGNISSRYSLTKL